MFMAAYAFNVLLVVGRHLRIASVTVGAVGKFLKLYERFHFSLSLAEVNREALLPTIH